MTPFIRYTLLRLTVFFACLLLLLMIPPLRDRPLVLLILAATASMLLSLVFLNEPREAMSARIAGRVDERVRRKHAEHGVPTDEEVEDAGTDRAADPDRYR